MKIKAVKMKNNNENLNKETEKILRDYANDGETKFVSGGVSDGCHTHPIMF